ncbi:MAG: vanadium-dependent haloperoxidase, partial [Acidimicrobiia bacterium]|nr:vanadium-dependent haloperoxidase [Acidimicrobiia bacterium]
ADDVAAARDVAISYAAYRILRHRYAGDTPGAEVSQRDFDDTMTSLCLDASVATTEGDGPEALGNRIAAAVIDFGLSDGSLEADSYVDLSYQPVNRPMDLTRSGTRMADPNRWQPLAFEEAVAQNGLRLDSNTQTFVGPNWGFVTPFALNPSADGLPLDPGPPPLLGDPQTDAEFKDAIREVIEFSGRLDPTQSPPIDISPASLGNNTLGANDGTGYPSNPVTGRPYAPNSVSAGDFGRVVAEFWADGPSSETPPGHWNTIANSVSDMLPSHRLEGVGEEVARLEWDVKLYFSLNGAVHDAAIAAWGAKRHYDYVRPISMIRYMAQLGQSSDDALPSYDPAGVPLRDDVIELITASSSAPGERHAHLAAFVGEIAVRAWTAYPEDSETDVAGVSWIRAVDWVPYQRSTFVTPAFAGYVSGHSAFSRAAAEVLTAMTGSEYFPGGLGEWEIPAGGLEFERGPEEPIVLQWATYYDAADQAGISRLHGGIHVRADDGKGRVMGSVCGRQAWDLAVSYFEGSA